jgi:ABC-type transporter Mla subunit MlaD
MAKKKFSSFLLGLFVTGGFIILAAILVFVGATQYFERGKRYITYFNESVQGLQKDSEVKFRGVKVGRVEDIIIAPDNKQVGVVMVASAKKDLEAMRLSETLGKSRQALGNIDALAEKLGQTSETLNLLVERIYLRPPDLFFGKPPKKRWNE